MTSAADIFARQLMRASRDGQKFLRGLSPADRDDVLAHAVLYCWEHRGEFDQHVLPLPQWFAQAIRKSRRVLKDTRGSSEALETLLSADDTEREAAAQATIERLRREIDASDHRVVELLGAGHTVREVALKLDLTRGAVRGVQIRLRKLRAYSPEAATLHVAHRHEAVDTYEGELPKASIDHAIEALLRVPEHGADCPPCWRCMWYYGLMPVPGRFKLTALVDVEVQSAVQATERRKIEIANRVRAVPIKEFTEEHAP